MKPDRHNYEIWIIDYLDGKLGPDQVQRLMEFIGRNPDIREEFEHIQFTVAVPESGTFREKSGLLKDLSDLTDEQFDLLCVGHLENDLSASQEEELQQILAGNQPRKNRFELITNLRLKPPSAGYKHKSRLKKLTTGAKLFRLSAMAVSTAAAIILFLIWFLPPDNPGQEFISENTGIINRSTVTIKIPEPVIKETGRNHEEKKSETFAIQPENKEIQIKRTDNIYITFAAISENIRIVQDITPSLAAVKPAEPLIMTATAEPGGIRYAFNRFVKEKILKSGNLNSDEIRPYEIADAGINGINTLLGWQMALNQTVNESGQVVAVNFNSKLLKFNLPVKKSE